MINTKDYDFSFSGLKTAVLYHHKKQPAKIQKSKKYVKEMCAEIQQAIIDVLIKKTIKAAKDYKVKTLIIGGGVSANQELRKQLKQALNNSSVELFIPPVDLSTDNALMTAVTGYFRFKNGYTDSWQNLKAKANLKI